MESMGKLSDTIVTKGKTAVENISDKAKEAVDIAREMSEVASLKRRIATCEAVIKKNYMEIGRLYYEKFADTEDNAFTKQCKAIYNAEKAIEALNREVEISQKKYKADKPQK